MKPPLKLNNENDIYYSCKKCYSYDAYLNIIIGGRGIGKTTTFLIKALTNYFKRGEQFIYLRRYKPELKMFVKEKSLDKVMDGIAYRGNGNGGFEMIYEDDIIGHAFALSQQVTFKSVDFSRVSLIIFDECTLPRGGTYRYLKNEVEALLEFCSTVFRTRTNTKVALLGNNVDLFNPYYAFFEVPLFDGIYVNSKRGLYCENAKHSQKLLELERETPMYSLLEGTSYGDYHYDNKLMLAVPKEIRSKPTGASLLCRCVINDTTLNIWQFREEGILKMWIERKAKVINDKISYILLEGGKPNYFYLRLWREKLEKYCYRFFYNGLVSYNDEKGGDIFLWVMENA